MKLRLAAHVLRGLILGLFLFAALVQALALEMGARIFRYQDF